MSFSCRIVQVGLTVKALSHAAIGKDPWATLTCLGDGIMLHVASTDLSLTAVSVLPTAVFADYLVSRAPAPPPLLVHVSTLLHALTVCGTPSGAMAKVLLSYPSADERLCVEVQHGERIAVSSLAVRRAEGPLLDLGFGSLPQPNKATLRGDLVRDTVNDLVAFQPQHVALFFRPDFLSFVGTGSPFGAVAIDVDATSAGLSGLEVGNAALEPKYLLAHISQCLAGGNAGANRSATVLAASSGVAAAAAGGAGAGYFTGDHASTTFERVTLKVNSERFLSVTHRTGEKEIPVSVTFTLAPLAEFLSA